MTWSAGEGAWGGGTATYCLGAALVRGFDPSSADAPTASIPPRNSGATIIDPTRRSIVCRIGSGPPCRDHVCIACATSQSAPLPTLSMFFSTDHGKSFLLYVGLTILWPMTRRDRASSGWAHDNKKILRLAMLLDGS